MINILDGRLISHVGLRSEAESLDITQDEAILREAGFSDPTLFYTGFAFRGWVAYA